MNPELSKSEFLVEKVSADIKEVLAHYQTERKLELIAHLTALFNEIQQYYETKDPAQLQQFIDRDMDLLKKYRSAFTPYEEKRFFDLFDANKVLLYKGYYTTEEFNVLPKEVTALKQQEVSAFCNAMGDLLSDLEYNAYKEDNAGTKMDHTEEIEESDSTEMQQVLAIHYLLKAGFNIEARGSNSVSQFTQLAHLLLGKKFTTLQNSNIYKKYKKLPNFENPAQLVKDLKHIRRSFEAMDLKNVVDLINRDLQEAESDNKHGKKK